MRPEELNVVIDSLGQGINPEGIHLELKRKWGDFSNNRIKENFIKSLTALVNARGDSIRHLIFGLSKSGVSDAPLPTDESNIQQLVGSNVDPPFSFEVKEHEVGGKIVTVLKILKSIKRPHVVKEHNKRENCIFVRRGSTIAFANRNELDEMYSERAMRNSPDLSCEITSDSAKYTNYRIGNYGIRGIWIEVIASNRGNIRTTIKSLSVSFDGLDVTELKIVNQKGNVEELVIPLNEGEGRKFKIYLSLKNLMDKQQAVGNKEILLAVQDIHGNEISSKKTIDIQ